jgi:hypothetical protein
LFNQMMHRLAVAGVSDYDGRVIKSWADAQRQPAPGQGGYPAREDAADPATIGIAPRRASALPQMAKTN